MVAALVVGGAEQAIDAIERPAGKSDRTARKRTDRPRATLAPRAG
jgi:hypothetical protein